MIRFLQLLLCILRLGSTDHNVLQHQNPEIKYIRCKWNNFCIAQNRPCIRWLIKQISFFYSVTSAIQTAHKPPIFSLDIRNKELPKSALECINETWYLRMRQVKFKEDSLLKFFPKLGNIKKPTRIAKSTYALVELAVPSLCHGWLIPPVHASNVIAFDFLNFIHSYIPCKGYLYLLS